MRDEEFSYVASSTNHLIYYYVWLPKTQEPIGIFQISHGMTEHAGRYNEFAAFLAENGYVVCANDHAGHGKSIGADKVYGYFAEKDGDTHLVNDVYKLITIMKKRFPNLPYYLLGHSMGSFIARLFVAKHGSELDGVIYAGTSGISGARSITVPLNALVRLRGSKKAAHGLKGIFKSLLSTVDWQCSDKEVLKAYYKDPMTSFIYTYSGYSDIMTMIKKVNKVSWFKSVPDINTFIFSGLYDPVGAMGVGVMRFYLRLKGFGFKNVKIRLYENARHEVLNEPNRHEVYNDILRWLRTGEVDFNPE